MAKNKTPFGILLTVAFLGVLTILAAKVAHQESSWPLAAAAALAVVASVASARLVRWSRFLVALLAAAFAGYWVYSIYAAIMIGFYYRWPQWDIYKSLAPGFALVLLGFVCSGISFWQLRARRP